MLKNLEIDCVLSIVDKLNYSSLGVKDKLRKNKIKHFKWIDFEGYDEANIYPHLDDCHSYIKCMLPEHNLLIHCQMDMSKSLSLVIAEIMKEHNLDYHHSHIYAKNKRSISEPCASMDKDLRKFRGYLKKHHPQICRTFYGK